MAVFDKGRRLAKRYPVLNAVPEKERPALVRAALRHPLVLLLMLGGGLFLLPLYFETVFALLGMARESGDFPYLTKLLVSVLLPVVVVVPLLSRFVIPYFILQQMRKRGFTPGELFGEGGAKPSGTGKKTSTRPGTQA